MKSNLIVDYKLYRLYSTCMYILSQIGRTAGLVNIFVPVQAEYMT
jgi:hypothetical protein